MAEPVVLREVSGDGVAVLTLNRPQVLNALSRQLLDELSRWDEHFAPLRA